jgi:hypothetical protein
MPGVVRVEVDRHPGQLAFPPGEATVGVGHRDVAPRRLLGDRGVEPRDPPGVGARDLRVAAGGAVDGHRDHVGLSDPAGRRRGDQGVEDLREGDAEVDQPGLARGVVGPLEDAEVVAADVDRDRADAPALPAAPRRGRPARRRVARRRSSCASSRR